MDDSTQKVLEDFWSKMLGSKSFREKLGLRKYARWAQDLTEEQFIELLCAIGEYGYRADLPLDILRRHAPKDDVSLARAMVGLEIIAEFTAGHPSREEEVTRRIHQAVADVERSWAEPGASPSGGAKGRSATRRPPKGRHR